MTDTQTTANSVIIRKDKNNICYITINRPKAYNSLSIECMEALIREFEILSTDSSVNKH